MIFNQVTASLKASRGIAYSYSTGDLQATWDDAPANGTLFDLHDDLDTANNAIGGCPISTSGF